MVKGLGQIGSSGSQRDPEVLKSRLASVLQLIGSSVPFAVTDVIAYPSASSPVYDVGLDSSVAVSSLVREFFKFTKRTNPTARPPELERVGVYHSVTTGTRVRISLLRVSFNYLHISIHSLVFLGQFPSDSSLTLVSIDFI